MTVAPFTEDARRYRELLESVHLVAVVMDTSGRVTFCNEFLAHLLQRPRIDLVRRDWFEYLADDVKGPLREAFLARINDGTIARTDENDIVAKNGERRTIAWNNTILRDAHGVIVGTASIGSD